MYLDKGLGSLGLSLRPDSCGCSNSKYYSSHAHIESFFDRSKLRDCYLYNLRPFDTSNVRCPCTSELLMLHPFDVSGARHYNSFMIFRTACSNGVKCISRAASLEAFDTGHASSIVVYTMMMLLMVAAVVAAVVVVVVVLVVVVPVVVVVMVVVVVVLLLLLLLVMVVLLLPILRQARPDQRRPP